MPPPDLTLYDNHGRPITYLRLAVTDRCNLRCFYCMPAEGVTYLPSKALLRYDEMERMVRILAALGVSKVRITGGEPFVRTGLMDFLWRIREIPGVESLHLTTNGVLTKPYVKELKEMGIGSVNLSLDTLDRERFRAITRRNAFGKVLDSLQALLDHQIPVKLNMVVMDGKNTEDIIPMAELTRLHPVAVRYIEEMPFNGEGFRYEEFTWNYRRILEELKAQYPGLTKLPDGPNATASTYAIPGYRGNVGVIAAFSRTFCGTCNRIRLTVQGKLKTCLYDDGVLDVRALLRAGATDEELAQAFCRAFRQRSKDGFEAEKGRTSHLPASESMSTIGG